MKKILFLLAMVCASAAAFGQTITAGPRLGVSSSQLLVGDIQGAENGDRSFGFQAGVFARLSLGAVYIQPEVLFSNTGGQTITRFPDGPDAVLDYNFNKLDVPILVGVKSGPVRFNVGPVFGVLLDAEATEPVSQVTEDVSEFYREGTFGFQAGVGFDLWNLIIDLKYEGGISQFSKNIRIGGQRFESDQRQNQFILAVGYRLF